MGGSVASFVAVVDAVIVVVVAIVVVTAAFSVVASFFKEFYIQGVPPISTHIWFQFLTFLIALSKNTIYAIKPQMV